MENWYDNILDYNKSQYQADYGNTLYGINENGIYGDPYGNQGRGMNDTRYKTDSRYSTYTADRKNFIQNNIESQKAYQDFTEELVKSANQYYRAFNKPNYNKDNNLFLRWVDLVDAGLPKNSLASFFDPNTKKLRMSWKATNKDAYGNNPKLINSLEQYIRQVRNDQLVGNRHNDLVKEGVRYFYKDTNGDTHWVDPAVAKSGKYKVSTIGNSTQEGITKWTDYELTGLTDNTQNEGDNEGDGKGGSQVYPRTESSKRNVISTIGTSLKGIIPDLLATSRLANSIRTNNRVARTIRQSLNPVFKDTYERYSPITGAFSEMQFRNRQAADVRKLAARPFTSDASLTLAGKLDANRQANDLEYQGFLADDKEIKRTQNEALLRQEDNMARRSKVANWNRASINQTNRERAQLEASRLKSNWGSWDNYLSGIETRLRTRQELNRDRDENFKLQTELYNIDNEYDQAAQDIQSRMRSWIASGKDLTTMPTYVEDSRKLAKLNNWKKIKYLGAQANVYGQPYSHELLNKSAFDVLNSKYRSGGKLRTKPLVTPKFQKGGSFDSFFTIYQPIQTPQVPKRQAQRVAAQSKESSSEEDDLQDFVKNATADIDGLPNEMEAVRTEIQNTLLLNKLIGASSTDLAIALNKCKFKMKQASNNKKRFDKTLDIVTKNNSLDEIAITDSGRILAQDKENGGKVKEVDLSQLNDSYIPLTVSNLLWMRQYSPRFMFENGDVITSTIENSMSYDVFQKMLKEAEVSLGHDKYSETGTSDKQALAALNTLQKMSKEDRAQAINNAVDGIYEYNVTTNTNANQIKSLITYLSNALPKKAKVWAALRLNRNNPDNPISPEATEAAVVSMVAQYLGGEVVNETTRSVKYKKDESDGSSSSSGSSSGSSKASEKMTFLTGVQNGYGGAAEERVLNLGGQANFRVTGTVYGAIADADGSPIIDSTLSDILSKSGLSGISNTNSIWFGDQLISPTQFNKVAINNSGGFRAILPCVKNGTQVRPNFELMDSFNAIVQQVNKEVNDNTTYEQRQKLLEQKIAAKPELRELLTATGKLDENKFQPFFIVQGLASDLNFEFKDPKNSKFMQETKNTSDTDYFKTVTKSGDYDADDSLFGDMFGFYDKVYKSDIFIPITIHNRLSAIIFSGQKIADSRAMQIEQEYQTWNKNQKITSNSNLLGI